MKTLFILLTTALCSFSPIRDQEVIDRLGVKGPLEFNGTSFKLSWSANPEETYYIQEYLPAGETTETFDQMLTLRLYNSDLKIGNAIKQKTIWLNDRKKTDPICNYQVRESPDGKEFLVDFLVGESKDDRRTIIEFNAYRYKQIDLGHTKKAILVYSYTKRAYKDQIGPFLNSLAQARIGYINQVTRVTIPTVTLESN